MLLGALNWLYRRLGSHYPAVYLTAELQTAFLVTAGTGVERDGQAPLPMRVVAAGARRAARAATWRR